MSVTPSFGVNVSSLTVAALASFTADGFTSFTGKGSFISFSSGLMELDNTFASTVVATDSSVSETDFSILRFLFAFLASNAVITLPSPISLFINRGPLESLPAAAAASARSFFFRLSSAPKLEFNGKRAGEILEWRL